MLNTKTCQYVVYSRDALAALIYVKNRKHRILNNGWSPVDYTILSVVWNIRAHAWLHVYV
jgi:hypothetical protein